VAISPDGSTMATGSADWTVQLWDLPTKKRRAILEGHNGAVYCMAFSSDSKRLATGSGDETVRLWDVQTGLQHTTLLGHQSGVTALAFSPDDKTLASAGRDDPVRLSCGAAVWQPTWPAPSTAPESRAGLS
jgi:WD40 repeat protein